MNFDSSTGYKVSLSKLFNQPVYSDMINAMSGSQPPKRKNNSINQRLYNLVRNSHTDIKDQLKYIGYLLSL